jgi:nicotinamide-nucleotide amidase
VTEGLLSPEIVSLAERVVRENAALGRRIALAESCTGGLVAAAITDVPGSSAVLDRGFVTYSNDAKREMLGVSREIIETFGAVSIACAWEMAQGAIAHSHADVAVAVSGIAGPDGGTDLKPVGTVVFARATRGERHEPEGELRRFDGKSRAEIRRQATLAALALLLP